jgi:5'-methylthioadenosine phosphorylase
VDLSRQLYALIPFAKLGGVYVQTKGPRIETTSEVQALAGIADVVGMTLASEATLACELGMAFAALCTVDNYANGLGGSVLTYDHILSTSREHRARTDEVVMKIIGHMSSITR